MSVQNIYKYIGPEYNLYRFLVYEIECVLIDEYGLISQVGVKGYGMQPTV